MEISENCGGNSGNGDSVSFRTKTRNRNMRKVKCDNCGGDNVETIADSFGICRDCGYKFVLKEDIAERRREEEEKNAVTQPIECEKCGSTDVEVIADSFGVCKHCGTKFVIKSNEPNINVTKNEINVYDNRPRVNFPAVHKGYLIYGCEFSPDDFLREVYIQLTQCKNVPADILDSQFDPVQTGYRQFVKVRANVSLNYNASIGYDHEEQYVVYEENSRGIKEPVTKTRTVTNWSATAGSYNESYDGLAFNDEGDSDGNTISALSNALVSNGSDNIYLLEEVNFKTELPAEPSDEAIEAAKRDCYDEVEYNCKRSLGGDHVRDFNSSGTMDVESICSCVAPFYSVSYKHQDKTYQLRNFAFGKSELLGTFRDSSEDDKNLAEQKAVPYLIASFILCFISIVVSLASKNIGASMGMLFICFVMFCVSLYMKTYYLNKNFQERQTIKLEKLTKKLAEKNMKPLDENEKKSIIDSWRN